MSLAGGNAVLAEHIRAKHLLTSSLRAEILGATLFLRCTYVLVACSKHVSIHTLLVHRGGPAVCSLAALGALRFLPEPPGGPGVGVRHRRVRPIVCVLLPLAETNISPSSATDLL